MDEWKKNPFGRGTAKPVEPWRIRARDLVPALRFEIDNAADLEELWEILWDAFTEASAKPGNPEIARSIRSFAEWSVDESGEPEAIKLAFKRFFMELPRNPNIARNSGGTLDPATAAAMAKVMKEILSR